MSTVSEAIALLESCAKAYAAARVILAERATALETEVAAITRRKLPGIRTALAQAADLQAKLVAAVDANPSLFVKPQTMTLHGIKFGFVKGKGAVDWDCKDDVLVARIESQYKGNAAVLKQLIKVEKTPIKDGLKALDAKEVARLGVTIEATGYYVFVKAADKEVDALVKKILKEGAVEETTAAAA